MSVTDDIVTQAKDYLSGDYEIEDVTTIPKPEDVPFGKKAKLMKLCAFCIDLRNSTTLLEDHHKQTAVKYHKALLYTTSKAVITYGGTIRSFNGDSLIALWPAQLKSQITDCVRAAMYSKWLLREKLGASFREYMEIDFGIGVDWGDVLMARAGLPRDPSNNDLIFIGKCINFAVAIANQASGPNHVEISPATYNNLEDEIVNHADANGYKTNMWRDGTLNWRKQSWPTKLTSYQLTRE